MRIMIRNLFASMLICFALSAGWELNAQNNNNATDPDVTVHPRVTVERIGVVNLRSVNQDWWPEVTNKFIMPEPQEEGPEMEGEEYEGLEKEGTPEVQPSFRTAGPGDTLHQFQNYFGNQYDGGIPNDNSIAVSRGGWIVSVANSSIRVYHASSGVADLSVSLNTFANNQGGSATKYDPKVTYDPHADRFIVVFLNGFLASNSKVVVCFSDPGDPAGNWNIYALNGSVTAGTWTDFPQIGISLDELFITGNRFTDAGASQGFVLWQIPTADGYAGNPLQAQTYTGSYFSLHPVQGQPLPYGPEFYLVRNTSNPPTTSKSFYIHKITNTLAGGGTLSTPIMFNSDISYSKSPDNPQKDASFKLNCNDCRIQTSYFHNDRIECAFNTNFSNKSSIYHATFTLSTTNLAFSSVKGQIIKIDSFGIGYPGICYGGCTSGSGDNSSVLSFNFASSSHYPGNAAVYLSEAGAIGAPKILKYGFNYMGDGSDDPWRWGDYSGASLRPNNPGEVWIGGSIGMGASHQNATWISGVFSPCNSGPIAVDPVFSKNENTLTAFPSPAKDMVQFDFTAPKTGLYRVTILDVHGDLIAQVFEDRIFEGEASAKFNTAPLADGLYFVRVETEGAPVMMRKFVVMR